MAFEPPLPPYNSTDPQSSFVASSCLDLLLIELVPMAYRLANELNSRDRYGSSRKSLDTGATGGDVLAAGKRDSTMKTISGPKDDKAGANQHDPPRMDEEEEREAVFLRLESLGFRVGQGLAERFSRDRPRFIDTLDVIKFICKDLWTLVFRKQIDNLKTNHRGVYVLTDNSFRPFSRMSSEAGGQAVVKAQPFLYFPCGILRGALASLGIDATVQAETTELPGATFQIKSLSSASGPAGPK